MGRSDGTGVGPVVARRQVPDRDVPAPAKASHYKSYVPIFRRVEHSTGILFLSGTVLLCQDRICMSTSFSYY